MMMKTMMIVMMMRTMMMMTMIMLIIMMIMIATKIVTIKMKIIIVIVIIVIIRDYHTDYVDDNDNDYITCNIFFLILRNEISCHYYIRLINYKLIYM